MYEFFVKLSGVFVLLILVGAGCASNEMSKTRSSEYVVSVQPPYPPEPTPFNREPQPPQNLGHNYFLAQSLSNDEYNIFQEKQYFGFNPGAATSDIKKETIRSIMTGSLQAGSMATLTSPDGNTIIFTVNSRSVFVGPFSYDTFSANVELFSVFSYDLISQSVGFLFSDVSDGKQTACIPNEFSPDGKYLRLECGVRSGLEDDGAESFGASVYSLSSGRALPLGQIEKFEWLKKGAFRYKVSKKVTCSERSICQPGSETCSVCYQPTLKLPWKYGLIK